jgi:type II secretory pathway pseudopilin PulG
MTFKKSSKPFSNRRAAFTLTEIAIVVGIIGMMISAIWIAATNVYTQKKSAQAVTDTIAIIQGVRSLYATAQSTGDSDGTNETNILSSAGIFPTDMVNGNGVGSAWGYPPTSSTSVTSQSQTNSSANTGDAFAIEIDGIPSGGCVQFLQSVAGTSRDSGLFYVGIPQNSTAGNSTTFPMSTDSINNFCNAASTVNVQLAFNLHG